MTILFAYLGVQFYDYKRICDILLKMDLFSDVLSLIFCHSDDQISLEDNAINRKSMGIVS